MRNIALVLGLGIATVIGSQGCASPHVEEGEHEGDTASNIEEGGDICGVSASQERAKATFDRTTSCALDAATAGVGDKLKLTGEILADTNKVIAIIQKLAGAIKVKDLNTARALLCVEAVTGYAVDSATKDTFTAAAVGLTPAEIDSLWSSVAGQATLGITDTFKAYHDVYDNGASVESILAFIGAFTSQFATLSNFITSCGTVIGPLAGVSVPSVAKYSNRLQTLGTIGSIFNCTAAVIGNGADLATELQCLGKDYARLAEQTATLRAGNDARCEAFTSYVANPAVQPIVASGQDKEMCAAIVHHWGSCVYDAKVAGFFGDKALSCDECRTVCSGFVNTAGANAYLEPVLAGAYAKTGAERIDVQRLVMGAGQCAFGTADGIQPCVNFCRGQVADCPAP